jgi:transcriptional regulator with XRE-family HTH domain
VDTLVDFLNDALSARRWSMRELARQADISHSTISQVISGGAPASANFCVSVAKALGESPERLLRMAERLPPTQQPVDGEQDALRFFRQIPAAYRELAIRVLEVFASAEPAVDTNTINSLHPGDGLTIRRWSDNPVVRMIQSLGEPWTQDQLDLLVSIVDTYEIRLSERESIRGGERS